MEGHCSTGQSLQWAVVPMEDDDDDFGKEEEEEEEEGGRGGGRRGRRKRRRRRSCLADEGCWCIFGGVWCGWAHGCEFTIHCHHLTVYYTKLKTQSLAAVITVVNLGLLSFWTSSSASYSEKNAGAQYRNFILSVMCHNQSLLNGWE